MAWWRMKCRLASSLNLSWYLIVVNCFILVKLLIYTFWISIKESIWFRLPCATDIFICLDLQCSICNCYAYEKPSFVRKDCKFFWNNCRLYFFFTCIKVQAPSNFIWVERCVQTLVTEHFISGYLMITKSLFCGWW